MQIVLKNTAHFVWTIFLLSLSVYLVILITFELPTYLIKYFKVNNLNSTKISCIDTLSNKSKPINFEKYLVGEIYSGEPAKLNEESSFIAKRFRSYFTEALEGGSNFAGHYAIAKWGFTGIGNEIGIVDVKTGKAYVFPYVAEIEFSYKKDSNLFIVDPIESICSNTGTASGKDISEVYPFYFLWENETFKLLNPQDGQPSIDTVGNLAP